LKNEMDGLDVDFESRWNAVAGEISSLGQLKKECLKGTDSLRC
jgi:hypothetical protein